MKNRSAGRRVRRARKTLWVDIIPNLNRFIDAMAEAMAGLERAITRTVESVSRFANSMVRSFTAALFLVSWLEQRRRNDDWTATHQLTASPSPWAAPITKVAS
jgi:hypothetical protein